MYSLPADGLEYDRYLGSPVRFGPSPIGSDGRTYTVRLELAGLAHRPAHGVATAVMIASSELKALMRILPRTGTFRLGEAAEVGDTIVCDKAEASFFEALANDAQSNYSRLRRLAGRLATSRGRHELPPFKMARDWRPSAGARPSGLVTMSAGMLLCIEQTLLRAMADESFFDMFDAATEWQGGRQTRILRRQTPGTPDRLEGLSPTLRRGEAVVPLDTWRACQFELLRDLAVQWVHLHEAAHVWEGHIHLLKNVLPASRRPAVNELGMSEVCGANDPNRRDVAIPRLRRLTSAFGDTPRLSELRRAIEYHADHTAFVLLTEMNATVHPDSAFARYESRLRRYAPDVVSEIGRLDHARRTRTMVTAAGAAMLVVEAMSREGARPAGYPAPMSRLLNLQLGVLTISAFVRPGQDGLFLPASAADDPSFVPWLKDAMMRPYVDLDVMAVRLGLPALFSTPSPGEKVGLSPFILDLLAWFDPDGGAAFVTPEARDLHGSVDRVNALDGVCTPYRAPPSPPRRGRRRAGATKTG